MRPPGRASARPARPEKTLLQLEQRAAIDPENERLWLRIGDLQLKLRRPELAIAPYWRAAQLNLNADRPQMAIGVLKKLAQLIPADYSVRVELARTYERMNRRRDAALEYQQVAALCEAQGAYAHALSLLERALGLDMGLAGARQKIDQLQPLVYQPPQRALPRQPSIQETADLLEAELRGSAPPAEDPLDFEIEECSPSQPQLPPLMPLPETSAQRAMKAKPDPYFLVEAEAPVFGDATVRYPEGMVQELVERAELTEETPFIDPLCLSYASTSGAR